MPAPNSAGTILNVRSSNAASVHCPRIHAKGSVR
jgi:hypothetical protein